MATIHGVEILRDSDSIESNVYADQDWEILIEAKKAYVESAKEKELAKSKLRLLSATDILKSLVVFELTIQKFVESIGDSWKPSKDEILSVKKKLTSAKRVCHEEQAQFYSSLNA